MFRRTFLFAITLLAALPAAALDAEISFWAVQATREGHADKVYGHGLEPVQSKLVDLPHDTFSLIVDGGLGANFGSKAEAVITPQYKLRIEPLDEEDGRVRMRLVVEYEKEPGRIINAVDTRIVLTPGKQVRLGGLKLDEGDLVIIFSAR